jgi:hypothetical protein
MTRTTRWLAGVSALVALGAAARVFDWHRASRYERAFAPAMPRFLVISDLAPAKRPLMRPKLLLVDVSRGQVDALHRRLAQALRAETPEEVATVVWIERGEEQTGYYQDGDRAMVNTCKITMIDVRDHAIVGEGTLRGAPPPASKAKSSGYTAHDKVFGSKIPPSEILRFVEARVEQPGAVRR